MQRMLGRFNAWQLLALLVLVNGLFIGLLVLSFRGSGQPTLHVGDHVVKLEVADTPAEQQKGLSGRSGLAKNSGMLFVYEAAQNQRCFWMKDMRFAIDIVWVDADKKVVAVQPNLTPDTYPQRYCNTVPAQYVLEVPAGDAQRLGLRTEVKLRF
jgi:uncharacterized protein